MLIEKSVEAKWLRPLLKAGLCVDNVCHTSDSGWDGLTPLLLFAQKAKRFCGRWNEKCEGLCAYDMQLMIKHGADVSAVDPRDGNTYMHDLVQRGCACAVRMLLQALGSKAADFGQLNDAKQSIRDLATQRHFSRPQDRDVEKNADSIFRDVEQAYQIWQRELDGVVEPMLSSIEIARPLLPPLAHIVRQYLDGSGKPFESTESAAAAEAAEDAEMKGTESAAAAAAEGPAAMDTE